MTDQASPGLAERPTVGEMLAMYVESDDFKCRCADVRIRQDEGQNFDTNQLGYALGVPPELAGIWLQQMAEKVLSRIYIPPESTLQ